MVRHHAEPNINILSTRNLLFDSDVRQWSHPLMIPLHSLFAKSNNRKRDQFECDVFGFVFVLILFAHRNGIIWRGGIRLKLDVQGQGGGRILDIDGHGVGGLERWTIFVDAMCVLSLTAIVLKVLFESIGHVRQFSLIFAGWDHAITWLSCHVCIYELKSYWINLKFLNENEIFEWNYRNWQNNTKLKENLNYRMN